MKSFKQKFLLFFIPPALLAMALGTYFNLTKIEALGMRNQMIDIGAKTLTFVQSVSAIDHEARNITQKVLTKTLIGASKPATVILDILENELTESNFANSLSLIMLDPLASNQIRQHFTVKKNESTVLRSIVSHDEISLGLNQMVSKVIQENSTYWTPKYQLLAKDTASTYSFYSPIFIDGKIFAIVSYNVDLERTATIFQDTLSKHSFNYYAFGKNAELISSGFAYSTNQPFKADDYTKNQKVIDTLRKYINHSKEVRSTDYITIRLPNEDDLILFGTFINEPPLWLFFSFSKKSVRSAAWNQLRNLIALNAIILVVLVLIIILFSNKLSKPVLKMQKAVNLFLKTNKKVPIQLKRKDELGILANELDFMQDELLRKEQEVRKLDEAKDNFLKMISHEIRTPLNGILGSAYFLKESIDNEDLSEFVDMLAESADRLNHLSRKALTITELQTRDAPSLEDQVNVYDFLNEVFLSNANILHPDKIHLKASQKAIYLSINKALITESINEIIHNTVRFANADTDLIVYLSSEDSKCIISFENTGPLITEEKLIRLAKPFELGQDHYDKYTGLGLALVSIIMKLHHGRLKIENTLNGVKTSLIFE